MPLDIAMTPAGIVIGPLGTSRRDLDDAGVVAARAFHRDPFFEFLAPRPLQRTRGLALFWRSEIALLGESGHLLGARGTDGRLVGVAAWVKPGCYPLPVVDQLRQVAGSLRALIVRPRALVDGSRYLLAIDKVHPMAPRWYLQLLVVDPSVQRRGIGGKLQAGELARADEDGVLCHLETQNSDNIPYYRRFGYEVVQEIHPVKHGPPLWIMEREPCPMAIPGT